MGEPSSKERMLDAGALLLADRAFAAIGVAEVCADARVPKGSFYHFFASKEMFGLEVVNRQWELQKAFWLRVLTDDAVAPMQRLQQLFDETAAFQVASQTTSGSATGCIFGRLALELTDDDAVVRQRIREIFAEQVEMLAAVIDQASPGARTDEELNTTAHAVLAQLEGLVMFVRLYDDPTHLSPMWHTARYIIEAAA